MATINPPALPSAASPSRALRSLPLSVMMSGYYDWNGNADWGVKNSYSRFWASTPNSYATSRYLYFGSTYANPKNSAYKPGGFTLRCVARFFRTSTYAQKIIAPFLPELSAASLFRL